MKNVIRTIVLTLLVIAAAVSLDRNGGLVHATSPDPIIVRETINEVVDEASDTIAYKATVCNHEFGEYVLVVSATPDTNGVEACVCNKCGFENQRVYVCAHENSSVVDYLAPTCFNTGKEVYACNECATIVGCKVIDITPCTYGEWYCKKIATPVESGTMSRRCSACGHTESVGYNMKMAGPNSIYIPGTELNHTITISSFTQSAVDNNDIVYTEAAFNCGANDPFVLGHNYGSMRYLQYTKVGQYIYLSINGMIEVYEVVVSEFAMQNDQHTNIIGQTTGHSIYDSLGEKTLHMYTCHGGTNGRWMVLAVLVETH